MDMRETYTYKLPSNDLYCNDFACMVSPIRKQIFLPFIIGRVLLETIVPSGNTAYSSSGRGGKQSIKKTTNNTTTYQLIVERDCDGM